VLRLQAQVQAFHLIEPIPERIAQPWRTVLVSAMVAL
jgi:hypothetical protein